MTHAPAVIAERLEADSLVVSGIKIKSTAFSHLARRSWYLAVTSLDRGNSRLT